MWMNSKGAAVQNESTIQCEPKNAGFTFSISEELAADSPPAAQSLFTNWSYGTLDTRPAVALLAVGISLAGLSLLAYLYSLGTVPTIEPKDSLTSLRIAFLSGGVAAIFLTNSGAQITRKAYKLTNLSNVVLPVSLNVWRPDKFYINVWLSVGLMWCAVGVGVILSYFLGGLYRFKFRDTQRSDEERNLSASPELIKEVH